MIVRKILIATGAVALISTPAWALPSQTPSNGGTKRAPATTPVGPPGSTPNNTKNPGSANRNAGQGGAHSSSGSHGHHGNSGHPNPPVKHPEHSRKCTPHKVGYVAGGTLIGEKLEKNADGTYSGELEVQVTHTNRHGAADKGNKVTYTLSKAHVTFGLADVNKDGSVGLDDLAAGDRVHLIGRITVLARKCAQGEFKATKTINRVVFHGPPTSASKS